MLTATEVITEINDATARFGQYNFDDKGPREVMDLDRLYAKMEDMPGEAVADMLAEVRLHKNGERFVETVLIDMQDEDKYNALYDDSRINDLY